MGRKLPCDDNPELFFEVDGERGKTKVTRMAAAVEVCNTCPLATREACLEIAMKAEGGVLTGRYGVFGGKAPAERARLAKERGLPLPAAYHPAHGTEARAKAHRRAGEAPCGSCLVAEATATRTRVHARKAMAA